MRSIRRALRMLWKFKLKSKKSLNKFNFLSQSSRTLAYSRLTSLISTRVCKALLLKRVFWNLPMVLYFQKIRMSRCAWYAIRFTAFLRGWDRAMTSHQTKSSFSTLMLPFINEPPSSSNNNPLSQSEITIQPLLIIIIITASRRTANCLTHSRFTILTFKTRVNWLQHSALVWWHGVIPSKMRIPIIWMRMVTMEHDRYPRASMRSTVRDRTFRWENLWSPLKEKITSL